MTEIPEHLLKRAAAARAAKGGEAAPADAPTEASSGADAAPAAAAPAAKAPAAPAPLPTLEDAAPKAQPDIAVVAAAKRRKRVPFWAMPVIALLPLWGVVYVASVQPPPAGDHDPLVIGEHAYTAEGCSGCHGAKGEGGSGQVLADGVVIDTFADPLSMAYWIHYGAADGGARPDGTYGDLTRPGGPHTLDTLPGAAMPGFPSMDAEEMAALIIYIREGLSGGDPADDPNFNSESFTTDPAALAKMIEEIAALEPGNPDAVTGVEGAETE